MFSPSCRVAANDTGNQLLAKLAGDAWHRLEADLERIGLTQGQTLQEAGAPFQYVYFPTTAVVSLVSGTAGACLRLPWRATQRVTNR